MDLEVYNRNLLNKVLSDKTLSQFINDNNFDDDFVLNHINVFAECLDSLSLCRECKGLNMCCQKKAGERLALINDGYLRNEIEYCDYEVAKQKNDAHVSSFVYSDIPAYLSSLDLRNIELKEESIQKLYFFINDIYEGKSTKGLYISGDLGVGKTYMCIALANSLVNKGKRVAFVKVNNFINDMRKLVINNSYQFEQILNDLKKADCLIMDDIGSESVSEFSREDVLFNILDYRMENKLTTLFTSNLSKDELLVHYTYDKKDNSSKMAAKRLLERIDILSNNFVLTGKNKRR